MKLDWSGDAAVLDGVDSVSFPTGEDFFDEKLDWCGDEVDFLTYSRTSQ